MAETEWTTRRAPHMERYVEVREAGAEFRVLLRVGNLSFWVGTEWETREEAEHYRDMLCIALDNLLAEFHV
jgi:hypothetical protein